MDFYAWAVAAAGAAVVLLAFYAAGGPPAMMSVAIALIFASVFLIVIEAVRRA